MTGKLVAKCFISFPFFLKKRLKSDKSVFGKSLLFFNFW
jgi:hypothetical protein